MLEGRLDIRFVVVLPYDEVSTQGSSCGQALCRNIYQFREPMKNHRFLAHTLQSTTFNICTERKERQARSGLLFTFPLKKEMNTREHLGDPQRPIKPVTSPLSVAHTMFGQKCYCQGHNSHSAQAYFFTLFAAQAMKRVVFFSIRLNTKAAVLPQPLKELRTPVFTLYLIQEDCWSVEQLETSFPLIACRQWGSVCRDFSQKSFQVTGGPVV